MHWKSPGTRRFTRTRRTEARARTLGILKVRKKIKDGPLKGPKKKQHKDVRPTASSQSQLRDADSGMFRSRANRSSAAAALARSSMVGPEVLRLPVVPIRMSPRSVARANPRFPPVCYDVTESRTMLPRMQLEKKIWRSWKPGRGEGTWFEHEDDGEVCS